ncbi:hypothetical protein DS742_27915 [Lacrimispora amygdalina]|uniref:DivIVA domain-containing protein n=1 Tax=Lacrimispora amygdalina TaxID=253257 RepID=A0A3E2N3R5_9FIRM|nr:hypothetical protein [Clostridium indicum]RFZ75639.1 hypothetical protein DS742_27915 [Clostridium indicum]
MELSIIGQEAIAAYLRQMKFKKRTFGGVDEDDALDKIEHITGMYRDLAEELQGQVEEMQQDIQRQEAERAELIARARREAEKIIMQAKVWAEQKEHETDRQLAGRRAEIEQLAKQRRDMETEMNNLLLQMKATIRLISGDLGQMLRLAGGVERKMDDGRTGNDAGNV